MLNVKAPFVLGFQITGKCTLNCSYCYAQNVVCKNLPYDKAMVIAQEIIDLGVFSISIEGGEPLLHPKWFEITKLFLEAGLEVAVLTNGTICDNQTIDYFVKLNKKSDLFTIQVSLDSDNYEINDLTRGKGKQVLDNLIKMIENGLEPVLATVVSSKNINNIFRMVDNLSSKIKKFHFMNIMPISSGLTRIIDFTPSKNELDVFWSELFSYSKNHPELSISTPYSITNCDFGDGIFQCKGCTAGTTRATISPDAKLLPCGLCPEWIIGDLNKNSFSDIWQSEKAKILRELSKPPCKISKPIWN